VHFLVIRERCAETQPTSIDSWPLELSSFDSVRSFADRFDVEGPEHLDVLVANAGTFTLVYTQTQDDWEIMFVLYLVSCHTMSFSC
jgi:retinol dehydrogenase 12